MQLVRQLVGAASFVLVGLFFIVSEIIGRLFVVPFVLLFPRWKAGAYRRHYVISRDAIFVILRSVGARFDIRPRVPFGGGHLVVMNHQSLLDIPVAALMTPEGPPRFVTHYRYTRGIPLVSYMIRIMRGIPVYPGRTGPAELARLGEAARTSEQPIVLFPEGHRTRDGEIRPWKRGALDAFLSARAWTVHVVVVDGLWQSARIPDFIRTLTRIHCRVESAGVFEYDGRDRESHREFVERMRTAMCDKLSAMRREAAPDPSVGARDSAEPARSG
jgi:1-acyl-sn-glycerol-3-phosphate acyltransferase